MTIPGTSRWQKHHQTCVTVQESHQEFVITSEMSNSGYTFVEMLSHKYEDQPTCWGWGSGFKLHNPSFYEINDRPSQKVLHRHYMGHNLRWFSDLHSYFVNDALICSYCSYQMCLTNMFTFTTHHLAMFRNRKSGFWCANCRQRTMPWLTLMWDDGSTWSVVSVSNNDALLCPLAPFFFFLPAQDSAVK